MLTSLALYGIYGPSVGLFEGEDSWHPDGQGGWIAHGSPEDPQPEIPSVDVPVLVRYLPFYIPAALLVLFMFTPLGRKLEDKKPVVENSEVPDPSEEQPGEVPGEEPEDPDSTKQ